MAPEAPAEEATSTNTPPAEEAQGTQGQEQTPPVEETSGTATPPASNDNGKLPDDHPLVKALAREKQKSSNQASELAEARTNSAKASQLEAELAERPTKEALDTLQSRYDRLEAFLVAAGGPLGRALDSRSFTKDLFESNKDIDVLVKEWHKSNPTATGQALGAGGASATTKTTFNDALRAARS